MDPTTMPLVSVVIPSYNHAHFVGEAIESILAQTYPRHEIIVIDDGSTDRTAEVVARYQGVRYVWQKNRGLPAARNRGIQESRGQYVVFLDADDRLLPQHFAISLEAIRSHPEVGWVCGNRRFLGDTEPMPHHCPVPDTYLSMLRFNCIGHIGTVMFSRQVLADCGGFDDRLKSCEDTELYLRLSRQTPLYCHHEVVAEYRVTEQQMSRQWYVMLQCALDVVRTQRRFVDGHRHYQEAYDEGLARVRAQYADKALWQMVADARSGRWTRAFKAFRVLLRCYPVGLVNLLKLKARKSFSIANRSS